MINQLYTTKSNMTQSFIEGKRVPVTVLKLKKHIITQIKQSDKDGYSSIQVAIGLKNRSPQKPLIGHLKASNLDKQPQWIREIKIKQLPEDLKIGQEIDLSQIVSVGDIVNITGTSLGKGFAGTIKRHGFSAQPRTHGQSDRRRAPGSIGRGTTPGRVLPGKKMAGHMGNVTKTVSNLKIIETNFENNHILVSGPVPGAKNQLIKINIVKKAENQSSNQE